MLSAQSVSLTTCSLDSDDLSAFLNIKNEPASVISPVKQTPTKRSATVDLASPPKRTVTAKSGEIALTFNDTVPAIERSQSNSAPHFSVCLLAYLACLMKQENAANIKGFYRYMSESLYARAYGVLRCYFFLQDM